MRPLLESWKSFFSFAFLPAVVIPFMVAVGLGYVIISKPDPIILTVLTILISIISGFVGGVLNHRWNKLTEETVIKTRGQTAVRSLKLLLGSIWSLDGRAQTYLLRQRSKEDASEITKTYLEEIIARCRRLEEEAQSSIENWTDIVPEADVSSTLGMIEDLTHQMQEWEAKYTYLNKEYEQVQGRSQEEIDNLGARVQESRDELSRVRRQLSEERSSSGLGTFFTPSFLTASIGEGIILNIPNNLTPISLDDSIRASEIILSDPDNRISTDEPPSQ